MERTRKWGALAGAVIVAVVVGAAGCDGDLDLDQHDAGVGTLVVRVLTGPDGVDLATWQPVPGATVALDAPGGARLEEVSGLDGRATFTGLDFSLGTAGVTAHVVDSSLSSVLGIADGSQEVLVPVGPSPLNSYTTVSLSGQALNVGKADGMYNLNVGAFSAFGTSYGTFSGKNERYSLLVPANEPFTLVAFAVIDNALPSGRGYSADLFKWTMLPNQLVEDSTILDIDLANAAETRSASGWVALPPAGANGLRIDGNPDVKVHATLENLALIGRAQHIEVDADGAGFNYTVSWVEPPGVSPVTEFAVLNDRCWTVVFVRGSPSSGPQGLEFLDCPYGLRSNNAGLRSTFTWMQNDEPNGGCIYLMRDWQFTWAINFPGSLQSVTLPALPSTVNPVKHFGVGRQSVLLQELDWASPTTFARLSDGIDIGIEVQ